jgi:hypothetical protein
MVPDEEGGMRKTWCFQVFRLGEQRSELLYTVNDICSSEEEAHALERLFEQNQVAAVHVMDVLDDWLDSRYD